MKFNVEGKAFLQQLQAVSKVINSKNTIKILDNFLLRLEGDSLSITGGDSENFLTAYLPVLESEGEGAIAINAKRLLDFTKEIDNQPLQFYINDDTKEVELRFLNGHFNFMGVDAAEFPACRQMPEEHNQITLPSSVVMKGIENTWFAVSTETSRPVMTGIFWDIHQNDITFVSSDTHKLVRYINSSIDPGFEASFILPSKTSNIIKGLLSKDDESVRLTFDQKGGLFEFGDFFLYSVFINGNYPNYNRVIPENNPFSLVADRGSVMSALRRINLSASKSSNLVVFNMQPNEVLLSAQDLDYGTQGEERLMCEYAGNTMTIGFNGVFMVDILANIQSDTVVMRLSDPARPCVFSAFQPEENEDLITIQMPMQVL